MLLRIDFSKYSAIMSLKSIKQLMLVMVKCCVFFEVQVEFTKIKN
jgi:hypothetical protein